MCKYKLTTKDGIQDCQFKNWLDANYDEKPPLDNQSLCVFHSRDIDFKRDNDFSTIAINLIKEQNEVADWRSQISVATAVIIQDLIEQLNNTEFNKKVVFDDCVFLESIKYQEIKFSRGVSFRRTHFENWASFEDTMFNGLDFSSSKIDMILRFSKIFSKSYFSLQNIKINGSLLISNSDFKSMVSFDNMEVNISNTENRYCSIEKVKFHDFVDFENSTFNNIFEFVDVEIHETCSFRDTNFNFPNRQPRNASVGFYTVSVFENGRIDFNSSTDKKIFDTSLDVEFKHLNIEGIIAFENTDFTKIDAETKDLFLSLSRIPDPKVVIGRKCLKYLNQTKIIRVPIAKGNQNLVQELTNTFTEYFTKVNGINLGVEIVDRGVDYIDLFYFSDDNISHKDFLAKLAKTEDDMWHSVLIDTDNDESTLDIGGDGIINKVALVSDTLINLLSIVLKIAVRIPLGKISKNEIHNLLCSTNLDSKPPIDIEKISSVNINQTILLGFNNNQTLKIGN